MKIFTVLSLLILLTGCNIESRIEPTYQKFETICLEGVEYFISESYGKGYMSVKLDRNSKVVLCESTK